MTKPRVIHVTSFDGAARPNSDPNIAVLVFDGGKTQIAVPISELGPTAGAMLQQAAAAHKAQGKASGLLVDAVEIERGDPPWTLLVFGMIRGEIPIALDAGQVAELRLLLGEANGPDDTPSSTSKKKPT